MKIVDVTVTLFSWDNFPAVSYGADIKVVGGSALIGLVAISTDEGIAGHSFIGSTYRGAESDARLLIQYLKPILIGADPMNREAFNRRFSAIAHRVTMQAIGAIDIALWDLAGKAANMPIYRLLGAYRDSIPAYASSIVLSSVEAYCEEALHYKSLGWQAYKIHAPSPWRNDIAVCTAVREAVGDDYPLMLDSCWAYDYPTALKVGRALDELHYKWFEDPLAEWSISSYVKLREKLQTPLMTTELPFAGLDQYAPWLTAQATDYLRGDVAFKGGITTCLKAAHLAEAFAMNFEIHHGGNSLNNVANLHVALAIKNCEYFEVLLPHETGKYGLVEDIEIGSDGLAHAPTGPGLGMAIDFDLIARQTKGLLT